MFPSETARALALARECLARLQVSDEHGLAFRAAAADASRAPVMVAQQSDQADGEDALEKRLAALRAEG